LFVVQKHDASRLHYDFRLEIDGVLKSWAVPKGPSLDPADKRLAIQTEDHPLEYGSFEGVIPEGEYGGGTVLLWDRGTWTPVGDPAAALRAGLLKFTLAGERLHGGFSLVRLRGPSRRDADGRSWLLVKERDQHARPARELDITAARPESVLSGRVLAEIARDKNRT
jgi:bifunctional non-homologous end joining protein LigD